MTRPFLIATLLLFARLGFADSGSRYQTLTDHTPFVLERTFGAPGRYHRAAIAAVAHSPSGDQFASADASGHIKVWSATSTQSVVDIKTAGEPTSLAYDKSGDHVVVGHKDGWIRVWSLPDGRLIQAVRGHSVKVDVVAATVEGFVSLGSDGSIRRWTAEWGSAGDFPVHADPTRPMLAISADGQKALVRTDHDSIEWIDLSMMRVVDRRPANRWLFPNSEARLSADGQLGFFGIPGTACGSLVRLGVAEARSFRTQFGDCPQGLRGQVFSPDGKRLASTEHSQPDVIRLWNVAGGLQTRHFRVHCGEVTSLTFSADSRRLISGDSTGSVLLWNLDSDLPIHDLEGHTCAINAISTGTTGEIVSSSDDETARVWRRSEGLVAVLEDEYGVSHALLSPDGKLLASQFTGRSIQLWDAPRRWPLRIIAADDSTEISQVAFVDGSRELAIARTGKISIWKTERNEGTAELWLPAFVQHQESRGDVANLQDVTALAVLPDSTIAIASELRIGPFGGNRINQDAPTKGKGPPKWSLTLWRPPAEKPAVNFALPARVESIALADDGHRLYLASYDGRVLIVDREKKRIVRSLRAHSGKVTNVAAHNDLIASVGADRTLKLWHSPDGRLVGTMDFASLEESARVVRFLDDGALLVGLDHGVTLVLAPRK